MKKYSTIILFLFFSLFINAQTSSGNRGDLLDNDFSITNINISNGYYADSPIVVKGTFTNDGVKPITSVDITYRIDNGDNNTILTFDDIHVELDEIQTFDYNVPLSISEEGNYTVTVILSNVNGIESLIDSLSKDITIVKDTYLKSVLVEEFSTEECPNCPPVGTYIKNLTHDNDNTILLVHHAGFYTDDYTIPESIELLEFYNGGTFAPAGMMDRHYNGENNDNNNGVDPGPVFWPGNPYGGRRIDDRLATLAHVDVNIDGEYNAANRELLVNVSGTFINDFTDQLAVSVWIVEDGIESYEQAGYLNRLWIHHGVARATLTPTLGDSILTSTNTDQNYSGTYSYTVPTDFVDKNISVIAFVNKMSSSVNEREILNVSSMELESLLTHYTTTFTVSDDSSTPLKNAKIIINEDEFVFANENGVAEIMLVEDSYSYTVEKYGYGINSGDLVVSDSDQSVSIELSNSTKTTFKIMDIDNSPLSRASVSIEGLSEKITDNEGEVEFMLSEDTYTYTIDRDGFEVTSEEFSIGAEPTVIEVQLIAVIDSIYVTFVIDDVFERPMEAAEISINDEVSKVTNENGESFFKLITGTYNYTINKEGYAALNGEFSLVADNILIYETLNIDVVHVDMDERKYNVYPTPFSNEIVVESDAIDRTQVIICNMIGAVVLTVDVNSSKTVIPTSNLVKGIYFVKVINKQQQQIFKVVKP